MKWIEKGKKTIPILILDFRLWIIIFFLMIASLVLVVSDPLPEPFKSVVGILFGISLALLFLSKPQNP